MEYTHYIMLDKLRESLADVQVIKKGDYSYFIHPLADGIPSISADLLNEIADEIVKKIPRCNLILSPEAMGIPLATAVSMKTSIPYSIIRKRSYGIPGEVCIKQHTGYSQSMMYVNGVSNGDEIVIIDDIISTGGTIRAIIPALKSVGAQIKGVVVLFNKNQGAEKASQDLGISIESLVDVEVVDDKITFSIRQ